MHAEETSRLYLLANAMKLNHRRRRILHAECDTYTLDGYIKNNPRRFISSLKHVHTKCILGLLIQMQQRKFSPVIADVIFLKCCISSCEHTTDGLLLLQDSGYDLNCWCTLELCVSLSTLPPCLIEFSPSHRSVNTPNPPAFTRRATDSENGKLNHALFLTTIIFWQFS